MKYLKQISSQFLRSRGIRSVFEKSYQFSQNCKKLLIIEFFQLKRYLERKNVLTSLISMADFHTGLCGCCEDISSCLIGVFCLPCMPSCNWALAREEDCGLEHLCCPVCEYWVRQQLRDRNGMNPECFEDCVLLALCYPLVLCQDRREALFINQEKIGSKNIHRDSSRSQKKTQNDNTAPPLPAPSMMSPPLNAYPQGYHPPGYAPNPQPYIAPSYIPPTYPNNGGTFYN